MRFILLIIFSLLTAIILWINKELYTENYSLAEQKDDIILQLNFLETELKHNNLGERMQQIFPEGYVFINALYGLTWCELALADSIDDNLKDKAIKEALYAYNNIDSETGRQPFEIYLTPSHGIFYAGWKNYLLSKILMIDTTFNDHKLYIDSFQTQNEAIINALNISGSPFLESYSNQSWPADMFVAMASLSNHDKIFRPKYQNLINNWIRDSKQRLDPVTKMIPHKVDSKTGNTLQGARGSSMGLILRMLGEINSGFAHEQYDLFKANFISETVGLPSIREYPQGQIGSGDIDSGPVIFGVGFSATIASIGMLSINNDSNLANQQYQTIHAFGFGRKAENNKQYLFGKLPMADAFIAWGRATGLNNANDPSEVNPWNWRWKFQLISALILLIFWTFHFRKALYSKIQKKR